MQSAMSNLVDVKHHNEQELEDELADLLSKDEPNELKTEKHHIPGILFIVCYMYYIITILNELLIFQIFQMYQTTV